MLTVNRRSAPVVTPQQQYALVRLDEDQVSQLLGHEPMKRVNGLPHAYDPHARYVRLRQRIVAVVAIVAAVSGGVAAWRWLPRPAFAAVFPWTTPPPTVGTAASFNVALTTPPGADASSRMAAQLRGLALPVFSRRRPNSQAYQVMVGPYVSLDEAEAAQGFLRARGYGAGRLFVDESVRNAPRNEFRASRVAERPGVLLVGAPDRLSLVLELESQPRRVYENRVNGTTLDIDVGPVPNPVRTQHWSAPAGVHLIKQVSVEEVGEAAEGGRYLRARLSLPEFSQASVRVDKTRVYVDLTWPQTGGDAAVTAPPRPAAAPGRAAAGNVEAARTGAPRTPQASADAYRSQVAASIARFEEATPFLLSAAKSPSPAVLAALTQTVTSLEHEMAKLAAPADASDGHALILAGIRTARAALAEGFNGDRGAQMQQAVQMVAGGRAALPQ